MANLSDSSGSTYKAGVGIQKFSMGVGVYFFSAPGEVTDGFSGQKMETKFDQI